MVSLVERQKKREERRKALETERMAEAVIAFVKQKLAPGGDRRV